MSLNQIDIIREDKNPKVLVVTPLLPGHKISKETKKTIKRNDTPILWISSMGNNNIPTNIKYGMEKFENRKIKFLLPLDNDISLGRNLIDRLFNKLNSLPDEFAYAYANLEYKGTLNRSFPAIPFDPYKLLKGNYISSNSLIKISCLEKIGGLIIDDQYKRLLDYSLWLSFLHNGMAGIPCPNASLTAITKKGDISTGSNEDYHLKFERVKRDFILPIIKKYTNER